MRLERVQLSGAMLWNVYSKWRGPIDVRDVAVDCAMASVATVFV